jgi:hypothetical protein
LNQRLEDCAAALRMKKHTLAQEAIEAAVDAIEKNDFKLVVPVQFEVTHKPVKSAVTKYPEGSGRPETYVDRPSGRPELNEAGEETNSPAKKGDTAESFLDDLGKDLEKRAKGGGARRKPRQ